MRLRQTLRRLRGDNRGAFAVLTAIMFVPILGGMAATGVDMSMWYRHADQMKTAADAAALAGAPALPGNPDLAKTIALDYAARNGYSNDGTTTVTAELADAPNELRVTIDTEVPNSFGTMLGHPTQRLIRSSQADYTPGLQMGSMCNLLGNEPNDANGGSAYQPLPGSYAEYGGDDCKRDAGYYLRAAFPGSTSAVTDKAFGDRHLAKVCRTAGTYNCQGGTNSEYTPTGYFFKLHVSKPGTVTPQVFDPAMIHTGVTCSDMPRGRWAATNTLNPYVTDARVRYAGADAATPNTPPNLGTGAGSQVSWCTGDFSGYNSLITPAVAGTDEDAAHGMGGTTLYGVRKDDGTGDPLSSPLVGGCTKKADSFVGDLTQALDASKPGYDEDVARNFRQWVSLCEFEADTAGDYWIQVRTDQPDSIGDVAAALNSRTAGTSTAAGLNGFSLRASINPAEYGVNNTSLQITSNGRMAVLHNTRSTKRMWLAQVREASAGRTMTVSLYDVGDTDTGTVTVRVLDPNGDPVSGCTATGPTPAFSGARDNCQISGMSAATHNGKLQLIHVPIPDWYSEDWSWTDRSGWYSLSFSSSSGVTTSYDSMTVSAGIDADPVRLTK